MTDSTTSPRIRAADDIETIYDAIQRHRREKQDALNTPEEGEKAPPAAGWYADLLDGYSFLPSAINDAWRQRLMKGGNVGEETQEAT